LKRAIRLQFLYLESFSAQRALETSRFGTGSSGLRWRNEWRRLLAWRCVMWWLETAARRCRSLDEVEG